MRRILAAAFFPLFTLVAQPVIVTEVARGLSLPTEIASAPDGSGRLFVVRQHGLINIIQNGEVLPDPFLDIRSKTRAGGERGLVGLAFSPYFAENGEFYITYVTREGAGTVIVARYRAPNGGAVADPGSEEVILAIDHTHEMHYGGTLRFGPDGYLYIGLGDGGSDLDEEGNSQNLASPFGKLLRIDVLSGAAPYAVPQSNPFTTLPGALPEIWSSGLRNPWKFSFDSFTGDLYIGDVGQSLQEEVDFLPAGSPGGQNYGWNITEGVECALGPCPAEGVTPPIHAYGRDEGGAVTGGFVYRGTAIPALTGTYVYGDFITSKIWGLTNVDGFWYNSLICQTDFLISTFGVDAWGELYVSDYANGRIYRLDPDGSAVEEPVPPSEEPPVIEELQRLANRSRISPNN